MIDRYAYDSGNKPLIGHPKYDVDMHDFTETELALFYLMKEQAGGKKIILWNSHFAVDPSDEEDAGTFLNFGIDFFGKA